MLACAGLRTEGADSPQRRVTSDWGCLRSGRGSDTRSGIKTPKTELPTSFWW